ncbi:MAG: hypothetical protein JW827_09025 [Spirochaetes bacterium]|nr:hypothetical protein [Spirochaetota bacterium]
MNKRVKNLSMDIKLTQWGTLFVTLILARLLQQIMTIPLWLLIALAVLCLIKPIIAFYSQ